jgi:hypothetical protein
MALVKTPATWDGIFATVVPKLEAIPEMALMIP